ncbi:hypothetical protein [Flavobacterium phage Fpv6]|uniref:hypothetical protein n=1 Tax=Flavobacterium phage Fpv7 TaxID=1814287 RepID=UPI00078D8A46|nr:hypothetical protein BOW77_gp52 [Flavobacterium phage Fpv7]YP_009322323.1 hypothetical protein BOW76_gp52 [Flavobacterium phage Fpv8]YP_009322429.1 hypothetical protein BOW79_gp52 [Flavobacterium phage Fpv5]YP_009323723.1 hypothetical protein BOW72_gp52 [Flavobacterium phage Fpv10]YP_009324575.1 hypothetical protein BOW78_gp52 [Flavobacterium phage Fpv6]YP_009325263.1 hypothetical protein BOW83_gp52 [Flavobacterium phage Fpv11]ALN97240.1 hypothetical protein [Flavobacterium phage FpV9]QCW
MIYKSHKPKKNHKVVICFNYVDAVVNQSIQHKPPMYFESIVGVWQIKRIKRNEQSLNQRLMNYFRTYKGFHLSNLLIEILTRCNDELTNVNETDFEYLYFHTTIEPLSNELKHIRNVKY